MPKNDEIETLFCQFNISEDCKLEVYQLYNTHKERFLFPFKALCKAISLQIPQIINNEKTLNKISYVKLREVKVTYHKKYLEIINVHWQLNEG